MGEAWGAPLLPRDALDRVLAALDRPLGADEDERREGRLRRPLLQEAAAQPARRALAVHGEWRSAPAPAGAASAEPLRC